MLNIAIGGSNIHDIDNQIETLECNVPANGFEEKLQTSVLNYLKIHKKMLLAKERWIKANE